MASQLSSGRAPPPASPGAASARRAAIRRAGRPPAARRAARVWSAVVVVGLTGVGGQVRAQPGGSTRPPVRIELSACVDGDRDAIERAVRIEVGEDAFAREDPD